MKEGKKLADGDDDDDDDDDGRPGHLAWIGGGPAELADDSFFWWCPFLWADNG